MKFSCLKLPLIAIYCITIIVCGCNSSGAKKDDKGLSYVESDDLLMNQAIDSARITVANFEKAINSEDTAFADFAVKKRFETENGGEHMWIAVLEVSDNGFTGIVNNDAELTKEVKYGDTVFVGKKEITDWMYTDNNILRGGYTIKAIRNKLSKEEKMQMDLELGFKIEE